MFTEFDVLVSVIILISTIISFMNGIAKDLLSLVGWVGAAAVTLLFFPFAASLMDELFRSSRVVNIAAVIIVYVIALAGISVINSMILDNLREFRLGPVDRSMGAVFGLFKGVVIVSIIHFSIITVAEKEPDWLAEGETYGLTSSGAGIIHNMTKGYVEEGKEAIEQQDFREGS